MGAAFSLGIMVRATPNMRPKKMTPSMSPSTALLSGLRVTMPTTVSIPKASVARCEASTLVAASPAYSAIRPSRVSAVRWLPGWMTFTSRSPRPAAANVVAKK